MSYRIGPVPGLGVHVVLDPDGRALFVASSRARAEQFLRTHLASRLVWRGLDELADSLQAGEVDPTEAVAALERWGAEAADAP